MQAIELAFSNRYTFKGKTYVADKIYKVNDALAKVLLSRKDERDMPYFRIVMLDDDEQPVVKKVVKKKAAKKKAARKKKAVEVVEDQKDEIEEVIPENLDTSVIEEIEPTVVEVEEEPLPDEVSDAVVLGGDEDGIEV